MTNGPLFSIIIPVYNMDRLILECVNSILAQKFKDYEIIIKDGLSSDKTLEVIKQINNKKTKIISNSDSGIYDAMNQGIHVATGSWIYFMGADDQFYNDSVLTNVSKEIEKYSNVDFFYGDFFSGNQFYVNKFNWKIMKGNSLNHQSIFYNKNIFIDNYYDTSYKLAADYKFNLQLYIDKKKSIKIPFIISKYGFEGLSSKNKNIGLIECERSRIEVCGSAMGMVLNFFVRIYDCLKRLIS